MDLSKFLEQLGVVMSAPLPHAIALFIGLGIIWGILAYSYSTVLANKNSQIDLLKDRIAAYESKLKVASPEQAVNELQGVRDQLAETKKQLQALTNPPRDSNGVYQRGRQIGVAANPHIDAANKMVTFDQMTVGGDLDMATNIEYRNLVLSFQGADVETKARQGLIGSTTYHRVRLTIVGNRPD